MVEELKVGLVGTGKFAGHHAVTWQAIDNVILVGVHGADASRLERFSDKHSIRRYDTFERLIEDSDILDIANANHLHCDYASRAVGQVQCIIIEKPIDIQFEKARAFQKELERTPTIGSVVSQLRFQRSTAKLKSILNEGILGSVETCRICVVWPRDEAYYGASGGWRKDRAQVGGGVLLHQCIHYIDLLHWFFGDLVSVFAKTSYPNTAMFGQFDESIESSFWGELEFSGGTVGQLYFTTRPCSYSRTIIEVFGTNGTLSISDGVLLEPNVWSYKEIMKKMVRNRFTFMTRSKGADSLLQLQFENVLEALRRGSQPLITIEDGVCALRTVLELYKAAKVEKKIHVNTGTASVL